MATVSRETMPAEEIKEVAMDVAGGEQAGGGGTRRRRGRRRATRKGAGVEETFDKAHDTVVEKEHAVVTAPAPAAAPASAAVPQAGGAVVTKPAVVVLAPAKKKPAKVMLVPKGKVAAKVATKTFKAKRVAVTIDNTAKTVKHRRQVLGRIDALTDDQLRAAAVSAKLSRRETVAKVPVALLRQMLKDYQTMRGHLL
jgi:hypothetical protein